uniref:Fibrinogen C-terminal domain-containing protein n=1 Tax=Amphimedon queenslandica TaxID=400682 RepID=A0A1X7UKF6_AMPQE
MEKIQEQIRHDAEYTSLQHKFEENSMYELPELRKREDKKDQQPIPLPFVPTNNNKPKQRQSSWSKPLLFNTVLLCLILILLIIILGIVVYDKYATGNNVECTNTATGASSSSNTNEWADHIAQNISQKIPDFNEWANGVVSKVNSNVTGSLPDFNEWANGVVSKVNNNVTGSLPDFNDWANGVISKVNSNVTGSLPDFNDWANGVVSKVNSNVTGSLPDFNDWANGVVSKVNSNVTGSLPDFNEWSNGVVSKVNSNVTGSLPDFNDWANGVVSKVNSNVTGSLPDFNEWANGVVSKVNSNVTGSLPDFNEWANGVSQNTLQLFQNHTNFTEIDKQILQTTKDSAQKLINIVNTLSNLQDNSTSTAGVVDDILLIAQELLVLHNDSTALPTSCKEIKERQPNSPSGYYILARPTRTYSTYCNMGTLCGSGGAWTRLAYLDMTDVTQNCPSGFGLYQSGGVKACGRPATNGGSCVSVQFSSNGISYSQICGRVTGYQYKATDAPVRSDINSYYVDGVSITRGSPRQHVWTFMSGFSDAYNINTCNCGQQHQVFIGYNYFCESGNPTNTANQLFISDPLWDGQGCGSLESACCSVTGIPWFHRDYGSTTTTDYIELRVCGDEATSNEDSPVSFYEIYIK